ncbi:hypothetical protein NPIL_369001 [Nephila pilipes]|uniref:Uncharacterized protein n=1 Tax=Nephila pilipes TaxID=299642 RepID=A0A8X6N1F2_NEPPI|nr:hypothetical protein NPIL_369001 [Nephila pilipes]
MTHLRSKLPDTLAFSIHCPVFSKEPEKRAEIQARPPEDQLVSDLVSHLQRSAVTRVIVCVIPETPTASTNTRARALVSSKLSSIAFLCVVLRSSSPPGHAYISLSGPALVGITSVSNCFECWAIVSCIISSIDSNWVLFSTSKYGAMSRE